VRSCRRRTPYLLILLGKKNHARSRGLLAPRLPQPNSEFHTHLCLTSRLSPYGPTSTHANQPLKIVKKPYTITRKDGSTITVAEQRRACQGASNAEINRELTALKRMFTLATQAGKLLHAPYVPLLEERNTRKGFFELEMLHAVLAHLPTSLRPVIEFAYITGWRTPSEVLTLEWRQVDLKTGEVRLDAETTKNREARVFPITDDLRRLLEAQQQEHLRLKNSGFIVPHVFVRMVAKGRNRTKEPRPIRAFTKAWKTACAAAGCPGRIPHDLRRTAIRNMAVAGCSNASRCSWQDTRRAPCSTATTSFQMATSEPRPRSPKASQGQKRDSRDHSRLAPKPKAPDLVSKFGGAARI
jgi:integrase